MWFSEKALIFVDTRSAALAVYRQTFRGPSLLRFGSERFESRAFESSPFSDVLADARGAIDSLAQALKAPAADATLVLPLGAAFPSIVDIASSSRAQSADIDEGELVRFRLAPLLPFPVAQAEVRTEVSPSLSRGTVLAQAIPRTLIAEAEAMMGALGFPRPHVTSALSAALCGLPPRPDTVDLVLGDSACAIAVRDGRGVMQAIHLRLLAEGDDRSRRSIDEAMRATSEPRDIRVLGEDPARLQAQARDAALRPAFDEPALRGMADPQMFPFLAVFHRGSSRRVSAR